VGSASRNRPVQFDMPPIETAQGLGEAMGAHSLQAAANVRAHWNDWSAWHHLASRRQRRRRDANIS